MQTKKQNIADLAARLSRLSEPQDNYDDDDAPLSDLERRALRDAPPDIRRRIMPRISDMPDAIKPATANIAPQSPVQMRTAPPVSTPATPKPAAAPVMPSDLAGQNRDRLVKLLMDVNDRLKRSETERDLLWRELETTRRLVDDLGDKSSRFDKQNQLLQTNLTRRDKLAEELIRRNQEIQNQQKILAGQVEDAVTRTQTLEERVGLSETTSTSLLVKINDLLGDSVKLSRRLDQMTQDKARLLRKIEGVEDTLMQTQDTLRARALVLLTDQTMAARTPLPRTDAVESQIAPEENWTSTLTDWLNHVTARPLPVIAAFVALGLLLGWGMSGMKLPHIPETKQVAAPSAPVMTQAQLQDAMRTEEDKAATAVTTVIAPLITPDVSLPPAIKAMERNAFTGAAEAQHDLAALYTAGNADVAQNYVRAIDWFTLAARRGVANARYNLGVLYQQGLGTPRDAVKAVEYYRSAAYLGHPEALYNLGVAAQTGQGMARSPQRAQAYFIRAANLGLVAAAVSLGQSTQDRDEAIFWYKLAADAGNANAQTALDTLASRRGLKSSDIMTTYTTMAERYPEAVKAIGTPAPVAVTTPAVVASDNPPPPPARTTESSEKPDVSSSSQPVAIVAQIQEQLARQNLYIGQADGQMSSALRQAIKTYQQQNRLKVDGEPSEDLLVNMLAREFSLDTELVNPTAKTQQ